MVASEAAIGFMTERDVGPYRVNFDAMPGAFSAILLDKAQSPAIEAGIRQMDPIGSWKRPKPVKATAWLISAIAGQASGDGPRIASELAATKRSARWGRSLEVYFALVDIEPAASAAAVELTRTSIGLFRDRQKRNEFSAPYYGSQDMNDLVIDVHLAAIWHVKGWEPSVLPAEERVFVSRSTSSDISAR